MQYIHGCLLTNLKTFIITIKRKIYGHWDKGREISSYVDKVSLFTSSFWKYKRLYLQKKIIAPLILLSSES